MYALLQRLPAWNEKTASSDWYMASSEIDGKGIFAAKDFEAGDTIGVVMRAGDVDEYESKIWNLTELGRFCNHQWNANVATRKKDNQFDLVALRAIEQDEELVASYSQVSRALGRNSRMQWQGEDVPVAEFDTYHEREELAEKSAEAVPWQFHQFFD